MQPSRSVALLLLTLGLAAACTGAPAAPPPPCAPVVVPSATVAVAPSVTASATAAPATTAAVPMQRPKTAEAMGFCKSDEMKGARDEVGAIDKLVKALPEDASPANPVTERMARLFASPCYFGANLARNLDPSGLAKARARSVVEWWNKGGYAFFIDALDHANAIHSAPSIPLLLAAELLPQGDPLLSIVCASAGAECDPLARGAAIDLDRELSRMSAQKVAPHGSDEPERQACARAAVAKPAADRLMDYVGCLESLVPKNITLPEARYRSPKGWLILRGRRGHYNFCDEARAYDLESGTAYIASRCAGLFLQSNGSVNQGATQAAGTVKSEVGTLSPDALRRLALLLWLKDKLDDSSRPYAKFDLPVGIPMPDPDTGFGTGTMFGSSWGHSGQTRLQFEIHDGKKTLTAGQLTWPDAADTGDQLADDLVVSAEATFQAGCPKVALPAALAPASSLGGVSRIDASPDALKKNADDLSAAFVELRKTKLCKK